MNHVIKTKELIAKQAKMNDQLIHLTDDLQTDLGFDSLDNMELIWELERAFDIQVTDIELENIQTVKDVVDLVEKYLNLKIA